MRPGEPGTASNNGEYETIGGIYVVVEALYDPAIPPLPAIPLVGRDDDLARIRQHLCAGGNVALTVLNGLPGMGKTAISIALAHDPVIRRYFCDGVLWAGLGPNPNIPALLSRWGTLLGLSNAQMAELSSYEEWAKALRAAIGPRSMLLVIDDAWKVEEAQIFKVGGPNCAHLMTTRFPSIASHITIEGTITLRELDDEESMDLLCLLAPQVADLEVQKVLDLVHAVGGLPLALTLMGNYLRKQAYTGQNRRITSALERLSDAAERLSISEPRVAVESHPSLPGGTPLSLQSVIAVTDQLLDEQTSSAFYALSIFPPRPHSFSEEVALAVADCVAEILDTLTDAGLIEGSGADRYTLHQTIADYARLHLEEPAASTAYERLIAYVIDYVEVHKKDYELLDLESSVIGAALAAAHKQGKQAELARAVIAFTPFMLLRAWYTQAEQYVGQAYEAALKLGDSYSITQTLLYRGEIALRQGNYTQAEAYLQEGLALARQSTTPEQISALLNDLGTVHWKRGAYAQAEACLQEGLALARQSTDTERISALLKILGTVAGSRGDYSQAAAYHQEGLTLARQAGNREQVSTLLMNLGVTAAKQGHNAEAAAYFQEGLTLARQIGHRKQICTLLTNLGEIASKQGHYAQAEAHFQEGLLLARQIGYREWMSALLINLGLLTRKQGNYAQAAAYFQESLALARQVGRTQMLASALYHYGELYLDQEQIEAAAASFQEMLATLPEGDSEMLALAQYGLARVAAAQGNMREARQLGEASIAALEAIGYYKAPEVRDWLNSITVELR